MSFVQVSQSVMTHRKTLRLARLLQVDRYAVVGRLVALWSWCLDNAPKGTLDGVDADMLADICGWNGKPAEFAEALVTAGFVEVAETGVWCIHDWDEHMGRYVERKELHAKRMRAARAASRDEHSDPEPTRTVLAPKSTRDMHVTSTSASRDDVEKRRVEKSRVEKKRESMPALVAAPPEPVVEASDGAIAPALTRTAAPDEIVASASPPPAAREIPDALPGMSTRPRDPIWDACLAAMLPPTNGPERGKWAKGIKALRESGATPPEIAKRAMRFIERYGPDMNLNPMSLASNWAPLGRETSYAAGSGPGSVGATGRSSGSSARGGERVSSPAAIEAYRERIEQRSERAKVSG